MKNAKNATNNNAKPVASICLYGNSKTGAGWIASTNGTKSGMLGDGETKETRGFTEALFQACDAIRGAGIEGTAIVYAPGGERYAMVNLSTPEWYGSLAWTAVA